MPIATAVEIIFEVNSVTSAMPREFHAALLNFADSTPVNNSAYQYSEKPPQRVIDGLSMNEYAMTTMTEVYRMSGQSNAMARNSG